MAEVRLDKEWTDPAGVTHAAGDTVDVDEATLAELRDAGVVGDVTDAGWAGPTFAGDDTGGGESDDAGDVAADINDTDLG